jgi:hypothetical protein
MSEATGSRQLAHRWRLFTPSDERSDRMATVGSSHVAAEGLAPIVVSWR